MTLCLAEDYQRITGDIETDMGLVDVALVEAQALVEEYLGPRLLEAVERTETLRVYVDGSSAFGGGRVYPHARPVTEISDPDGLVIMDGATVRNAEGVWPDFPFYSYLPGVDPYPRLTMTYTGGWTNETVPASIKRAIARIGHLILQQAPVAPIGAIAAHVGDVGVQYSGPQSADTAIDAILCTLDGYKLKEYF